MLRNDHNASFKNFCKERVTSGNTAQPTLQAEDDFVQATYAYSSSPLMEDQTLKMRKRLRAARMPKQRAWVNLP